MNIFCHQLGLFSLFIKTVKWSFLKLVLKHLPCYQLIYQPKCKPVRKAPNVTPPHVIDPGCYLDEPFISAPDGLPSQCVAITSPKGLLTKRYHLICSHSLQPGLGPCTKRQIFFNTPFCSRKKTIRGPFSIRPLRDYSTS